MKCCAYHRLKHCQQDAEVGQKNKMYGKPAWKDVAQWVHGLILKCMWKSSKYSEKIDKVIYLMVKEIAAMTVEYHYNCVSHMFANFTNKIKSLSTDMFKHILITECK